MNTELSCSNEDRFKAELEFIQCLASPQYINWLAQNRYFEDSQFLCYLDYLSYWRRPEYSGYLIYSHCLFFLDLLRSKEFRSKMADTSAMELLHSQQLYFYQHYRNNRLRQAKAAE